MPTALPWSKAISNSESKSPLEADKDENSPAVAIAADDPPESLELQKAAQQNALATTAREVPETEGPPPTSGASAPDLAASSERKSQAPADPAATVPPKPDMKEMDWKQAGSRKCSHISRDPGLSPG